MDPKSRRAHEDKCPVVSVILAIEEKTSLVFRKSRGNFDSVDVQLLFFVQIGFIVERDWLEGNTKGFFVFGKEIGMYCWIRIRCIF